MCSGFIYVVACVSTFLWLMLFHHMEVPHVCIHSPANGPSRCFYSAGVMSEATISICVHISAWTYVSSSLKCAPRVELLSHMCTPSLTFQGTARRFPKWLSQFTFSQTTFLLQHWVEILVLSFVELLDSKKNVSTIQICFSECLLGSDVGNLANCYYFNFSR